MKNIIMVLLFLLFTATAAYAWENKLTTGPTETFSSIYEDVVVLEQTKLYIRSVY